MDEPYMANGFASLTFSFITLPVRKTALKTLEAAPECVGGCWAYKGLFARTHHEERNPVCKTYSSTSVKCLPCMTSTMHPLRKTTLMSTAKRGRGWAAATRLQKHYYKLSTTFDSIRFQPLGTFNQTLYTHHIMLHRNQVWGMKLCNKQLLT